MPTTKAHLIPTLSTREYEVLSHLSTGLLYREIAEKLNISMDTVKKHNVNIHKKLNARNKTEAILTLNTYLKTINEP